MLFVVGDNAKGGTASMACELCFFLKSCEMGLRLIAFFKVRGYSAFIVNNSR